MATLYAWSKIAKTVNEFGKVEEWIMPGDKVSASDIEKMGGNMDELIASGAVRELEYPDIPAHMSPAEFWRANPDAMQEAGVVEITEIAPTELAQEEAEAAQALEPEKQSWQKK